MDMHLMAEDELDGLDRCIQSKGDTHGNHGTEGMNWRLRNRDDGAC